VGHEEHHITKNLVIYTAVQKHLAYICYTVHLTLSVLLVWQNLGGWCTNECTNKNTIVCDQSRHNIGRSSSVVICDTDGSPF